MKHRGKIKVEGEIYIIQETKDKLLIRENTGIGFSTPFWIPKSKIIGLDYVKVLPSDARIDYDNYVKINELLGYKTSFSFEEYYEKANETT